MGRLIIHAGYPKVASTFLQRQILDTSQNINGLYGDVGTILAERDDSRFVWFRPWERNGLIKRLVEQIEAERKPTVISHESLCIGDWMTYYDYSEDPDFITERLRTNFPDAEIMLFLRAQSSWFASWYRQHVSGGVTLSAEAMLETPVWQERIRETLEYDRKVKQYQAVFGPERVRLFYYNDLVAGSRSFRRLAVRLFPGRAAVRLSPDTAQRHPIRSAHPREAALQSCVLDLWPTLAAVA